MANRFDFSAVESVLADECGVAETIEVAATWSRIEALYAAMKEALAPHAEHVLVHFSHAYSHGTSMYIILLGRATDAVAGEQALRTIWDTTMAVALAHHAVISHHHGVGLARRDHVRTQLGAAAGVLDRVKKALDPSAVLNRGKFPTTD
jgi:alkyldihydroxyacetonephosphate synthase